MKYKTTVSVLAAFILAFTSFPGFAGQGQGQGQGQGGGQNADRAQQVDRDRSYDWDRQQDRDRVDSAAHDQDRDRTQDRSQMRDQDIYGHEFMSAQERDQYRAAFAGANGSEEANKFQMQHEKEMQNRAMEQGRDLVPPGQGSIYGGEFMTVQERNEYREQLRTFGSEQERQKFMVQHQEQMNARATALGHEIEEAE